MSVLDLEEDITGMNGYKYLLKNIGLLTISQFATKILSFLLVPLYTNILTTTEYGTFDLLVSTISVLIPILTLNIQESVIRFLLDKSADEKAIVCISTKYFTCSNLVIAFLLLVNHVFNVFTIIDQYALYFLLLYFVQSLSGILIAYVRGVDRVADLSISSIISSAVTITSNILFLVVFRWGLQGYFLASSIGPFAQCVYLCVRSKFFRKLTLGRYVSDERKMLLYSKPLIANSVAWWVNSVSDRYVVSFFCGVAENGIYSISGKIPQILNVFQTIFNQAWTLSAVKDFDADDKNGFFTDTYKMYNCILVIICSGIIFLDKVLAKLLYAKEFYLAWRYVPWLTIAIIFGALSGYIGGFFSAVKDSKIFATSTVLGAVTNIVLNLIFTPLLGAMGAAIATAISYIEVWIFRYVKSKRIIRMNINLRRDVFSYLILIVQSIVLLFLDGVFLLITECALFIFILVVYVSEIKRIVEMVIKRKE